MSELAASDLRSVLEIAHLRETTQASQRVFEGNFLKVNRDTVRLPDGKQASREYIVHPGACAIIPLLPNGNIVMVRQWRHPLQRVFLEFPAGKIDLGEAPLATAQRELEEECGYRAAHWQFLMTYHPVIAYADEHIDLYLARDLTKTRTQLDEGEFVEVCEVALDDLMLQIKTGAVTDSKTIIGAFWLEKLRRSEWS